jgi:hypothetical protein
MVEIIFQIRGLAVAVKPKNWQENASVTRVVNVSVGSHHRRGFTLIPGVNEKCRHTTVLGESIGDVPTRYTITGLEAHELPVIGKLIYPIVYINDYQSMVHQPARMAQELTSKIKFSIME